MKKHISTILAIATLLILLFVLSLALYMNTKMETIRKDVADDFAALDRNINNISGNVKDAVEKESTILSLAEWQYAEFREPVPNIPIHCTIIPKQYTPGTTKASIVINGGEYPMTEEDGKYSVDIDLPFWKDSAADRVILYDSHAVRTQALSWIFSPREEFLPSISANFQGARSTSSRNAHLFNKYKGLIQIDIDQKKSEILFTEASILTRIDNQDTDSFPIPLDADSQAAYRKKVRSSDEAGEHTDTKGKRQELYCDFTKTIEAPAGSQVSLYADLVDQYGLHYYALIDTYQVTDRAELALTGFKQPASTMICDKEGTLLYSSNELKQN